MVDDFADLMDEDSELDLLGGLMGAAAREQWDILDEVFAAVPTPDIFTLPDRAKLYAVLRDSYVQGVPLTLSLAQAELRRHGNPSTYDSWGEMMAEVSVARQDTAASPDYARVLTRLWRLRKLILLGERIRDDAWRVDAEPEEVIATRSRELTDLMAASTCSARISDQLRNSWREVAHGCPYIPTGLDVWDQRWGGLEVGGVTILAAHPSTGKTALALQWAAYASANGYPTLLVSIEMQAASILARLVAQQTSRTVDWQRTKAGDQLEILWRDAAERVGDNLYQVNGVTDLDTILGECRQRIRRDGIKLVVVDYLQLIHRRAHRETRNLEIAAISGAFKKLATCEGVAVLLLSQLNRTSHNDTSGPSLHHLRDSGSIEQDADVVAFLLRRGPEFSDGGREVRIDVQKNRQGSTGKAILLFHGPSMTFTSRVEPLS